MADCFRFGWPERFLLGVWILLATSAIIAVFNVSITDPPASTVTVVRWWAQLGVATVFAIFAMPAVRQIYWEYVSPRTRALGRRLRGIVS